MGSCAQSLPYSARDTLQLDRRAKRCDSGQDPDIWHESRLGSEKTDGAGGGGDGAESFATLTEEGKATRSKSYAERAAKGSTRQLRTVPVLSSLHTAPQNGRSWGRGGGADSAVQPHTILIKVEAGQRMGASRAGWIVRTSLRTRKVDIRSSD